VWNFCHGGLFFIDLMASFRTNDVFPPSILMYFFS